MEFSAVTFPGRSGLARPLTPGSSPGRRLHTQLAARPCLSWDSCRSAFAHFGIVEMALALDFLSTDVPPGYQSVGCRDPDQCKKPSRENVRRPVGTQKDPADANQEYYCE